MPLLRTIGGRVRTFRLLKRAVTHHGQRIAEILNERVNSLLPENLRIDFWLFMLAVVDLLRRRCDRLTGAEHELVGERANDARHQRGRDRDSDELRSEMRVFRNAFESHYLPENVEEFGFPSLLADIPFEVLRQADYLVETMSRPSLVLPDPKVGVGLPIPDLVAGVKAVADRLRLSLDATDREVKMAELAKLDKDDAAAEWDAVSSWAVRSITGLFTLAGKPELAARVLPSTARRGRTGGASGGEANEGGPPPGEDPTDEPPASDGSSSSDPPASEPSATPG